MGLLSGVLGNASEIKNLDTLESELSHIILEEHGEVVKSAYKLIRDFFVFTNVRLIIVDKQGITGKKIEYLTIPYRSIVAFSIETAGHIDLDSELKILISGHPEPIRKEFKKGCNIANVQKTLAKYVLSK